MLLILILLFSIPLINFINFGNSMVLINQENKFGEILKINEKINLRRKRQGRKGGGKGGGKRKLTPEDCQAGFGNPNILHECCRQGLGRASNLACN
ncbi:hypothetical protein ACQ4LE_006109 [Meloidogyne hapla]|uniref:IlGF domain-containing protein n=1 Tax=Meloidogyne hapla TaxID=6305 RepID=A0A1I8BPD5_MELHA